MTREFAPPERLTALVEAVCEDRATADELRELERLVLVDPQARWFYLTYIDLHGSLHWDAGGGRSDEHETEPATGRRWFSDRKTAKRAFVFAATLLVAVIGWQFLRPGNPGVNPVGQPDPQLADADPADPPTTKVNDQGVPPRRKGPVRLGPDAPSEPTPSPVQIVEAPKETPQTTNEAPVVADASQSLGQTIAQINVLFRTSWERSEIQPSPVAEDAEFVRRTYLDLVGRIPTLEEAERFLASKQADKRRLLVDQLLDSSEYARNFTTVWTNLLIGRAENPRVDRPAFQKFLRMSFASNRPWNEMVADLVSAEGTTHENGAANFLVAHLNNQAVPATAITARVLLGVQVQCAQCHNHPFNDTQQASFWELNSLFKQTAAVDEYRRDPVTGKREFVGVTLVTEPEGGPLHYETRNGLMKVAMPRFNGHEIDPGPEVNRRKELARLMTTGDQPQLAAAFVNRLWAHFLGSGFTRQVDDLGPHNPPSHPEVLDQLTTAFLRSGYDVKQLIRAICSTEVYQLSSRATDKNRSDDPQTGSPALFTHVYAKPMTAEQLFDSLLVASHAHQNRAGDWTQAEARRQAWLKDFVVSLQNDENDEVDTLAGNFDQALMLMNGELVDRAVDLAPGTFLGDLVRGPGSETDKIKRLCVAALSRPPSPKELPAMQRLVRNPTGYQDLFWALLNSNEFAIVH